jgi:hypothetical protein
MLFDTEGFSTQDRWIYDARGSPQIRSRPKVGFRLMPLTDAFKAIRAEVSNCRIFAIFATLNPLKLQCRRSHFPLSSNFRAITLRLYKKLALGAG